MTAVDVKKFEFFPFFAKVFLNVALEKNTM